MNRKLVSGTGESRGAGPRVLASTPLPPLTRFFACPAGLRSPAYRRQFPKRRKYPLGAAGPRSGGSFPGGGGTLSARRRKFPRRRKYSLGVPAAVSEAAEVLSLVASASQRRSFRSLREQGQASPRQQRRPGAPTNMRHPSVAGRRPPRRPTTGLCTACPQASVRLAHRLCVGMSRGVAPLTGSPEAYRRPVHSLSTGLW